MHLSDHNDTATTHNCHRREHRVPFTIGDHTFTSTVAARSHASEVLNSATMYTPLIDDEAAFVGALFARHPRAVEKARVGIDHFEVRPGPTWPSRNFWLVRTDGTADNFSIKKCLHVSSQVPTPARGDDATDMGGAR